MNKEMDLPRALVIGVISDTHGLLRPEAVDALRGCGLILHAGDIGKPEVLEGLRHIAPLVAVRGNVDRGGWAAVLPEQEMIETGGLTLYLLHRIEELDLDPVSAGVAAVISGHSHVPQIVWKDGILYFNPGSAGPKRWNLPVSVGLLSLNGGRVEGRIVTL